MERVEALGRAEQRVTTTSWNPDLPNAMQEQTVSGQVAADTRSEQWHYNNRGQVDTYCVGPATTFRCGAQSPIPPDIRVTTFEYCEKLSAACPLVGLLKAIDGPRSDVTDITRYEYRDGALHYAVAPLGHTTEYAAYDDSGRPLQIVAPDGIATTLTYHPRGWLASRTVGATSTTSYSYTPVGDVERITFPDQTWIVFGYDQARRLTSVRDSAGNGIAYVLNAAGSRTQQTVSADDKSVTFQLTREFDGLNRLSRELNANSVATYAMAPAPDASSGYDASGNLASWVDAQGTPFHQVFDGLNRVSSLIQNYQDDRRINANATTTLEYDVHDRVRRVLDPDGVETSYTFDAIGDLVGVAGASGYSSYGYDSAGNKVQATDSRGITAHYSYDALNRLAVVKYNSGAPGIGLTYDGYSNGQTCAFQQPKGRLTQFTDGSGSTILCYDARGNVVRKVQNADGNDLDYAADHNAADRLMSLTYPSGADVSYRRDAAGRITEIDWHDPSTQTSATIVANASYLPFGPLSEMTFGNGRSLRKIYDTDYAIDRIVSTAPDGLILDFSTDAQRNIVDVSEDVDPLTPPHRSYGYDRLSRLRAEWDADGMLLRGYDYSAAGDRITEREGTAAPELYNYAPGSHRLHRVGDLVRSYDSNGNTLSRNAESRSAPTLVYNESNRLTSVEATSSRVEYAYNARGERVIRRVIDVSGSRTVTVYLYGERGELLGEYTTDATGHNTSREYVYLDELPVAVSIDGVLSYLETDHLGTPRVAFDPKTNAWQWRWSFLGSAFGDHSAESAPVNGITLDLRFPGQRFDSETGLHYNYFREYEPETGRYLESDPIGLGGGTNTYAYVGGNPTNYSDPMGLRPLTDCEKGLLSPYIPQVDLDSADLHDGDVPKYLGSEYVGITRGNDIYFRPGVYDTTSPAGLALIGHELVHVGQYRRGMSWLGYLWSTRHGYEDSKYEKPAYALEAIIQKGLTDGGYENPTGDCGCPK